MVGLDGLRAISGARVGALSGWWVEGGGGTGAGETGGCRSSWMQVLLAALCRCVGVAAAGEKGEGRRPRASSTASFEFATFNGLTII